MRYRIIHIFHWTTAIAVVLFLVLRVLGPIMESENRMSHQDALVRASLIVLAMFIVGYIWMVNRVITPRDRHLFAYTLYGAAIGAGLFAMLGVGRLFLVWRPDFPVDELGYAVGAMLGAVPGAVAGLCAANFSRTSPQL